MTEQWQELKETIIELRDNDGTGTQQEVCKFLANLMDVLEKQTQEHCTDAISRKDMAQNIVSFYNKATGKKKTLDFLCKCVEGLPSVQPKTDWIPVSERLPKGYQRILATKEMFHWANEPVEYTVDIKYFGGSVDFVAWMPLPEPYKAESEE